MQKAINFNDVATVSIKGNDCRIHFWYMSKDDGISLMNNSSLNEKAGSLSFFSLIYNMSEKIYHEKYREVTLNRARRYYHDNIEVLREEARNKYRELSDDEKNRKESMDQIDIIGSLKKLDKKAKNIFLYNMKNDARTSL